MAMAASSAAPGLSKTAKNSSARVSTAWPANATAVSRSSVRTSPISSRYSLAQPFDEAGGVLDVGHQHGEEAGRQRGRFAGPTLPEGALGVQLAGDEPEGHDPVLLGGVEQPRRARSRAASSSKWTWLNRASALRTWAASWIGSRRRPREST